MSVSSPCPECGQPAGNCYLICPTQDPFQGDQYAEHVAHEEGARYDDVRERYAAEAADMELEAEYAHEGYEDAEQEAYYAAALEQDTLAPDMDAFFGQFEAEAGEELPF